MKTKTKQIRFLSILTIGRFEDGDILLNKSRTNCVMFTLFGLDVYLN